MDVPMMLRRAVEEFGARVSEIREGQWEAGTPDTEWCVRDLVDGCTTWFAALEDAYRDAGAIAGRPAVPGGAGAQTRLLAMFGRRA